MDRKMEILIATLELSANKGLVICRNLRINGTGELLFDFKRGKFGPAQF